MSNDQNGSSGFFGNLNDVVTSLKNLVVSANTIQQTLASVFPEWTAGQIPGTTTNGNATAGNIGEYISSTVLSGAPVAITTSTDSYNVTSISLTGGDWDAWGTVGFIANSSTTATVFEGGINTTTATLPTTPGAGAYVQLGLAVSAAGLMPCLSTGPTRISVATTTTVYLVASATFAVSTMSAYGFLGARRRR